jgi:broad specificity phosphatase PhoE
MVFRVSHCLVSIFILVAMSPVEVSGEKTVFLIRHAESEENRRISSLKKSVKNLGRAKLPTREDMTAIGELLNIPAQIDSNVSENGNQQITRMREKLEEENFLVSADIKLVVHSPLTRARETSEGMLGCVTPDTKVDSVERVVETALLSEMTPSEWTPMYRKQFKKRVKEFEKWLSEQPEDNIAIVGHSEYFKSMLGLGFKFGNCDVWQLTFDLSTAYSEQTDEVKAAKRKSKKSSEAQEGEEEAEYDLPPQWSDLKKLYTGL